MEIPRWSGCTWETESILWRDCGYIEQVAPRWGPARPVAVPCLLAAEEHCCRPRWQVSPVTEIRLEPRCFQLPRQTSSSNRVFRKTWFNLTSLTQPSCLVCYGHYTFHMTGTESCLSDVNVRWHLFSFFSSLLARFNVLEREHDVLPLRRSFCVAFQWRYTHH